MGDEDRIHSDAGSAWADETPATPAPPASPASPPSPPVEPADTQPLAGLPEQHLPPAQSLSGLGGATPARGQPPVEAPSASGSFDPRTAPWGGAGSWTSPPAGPGGSGSQAPGPQLGWPGSSPGYGLAQTPWGAPGAYPPGSYPPGSYPPGVHPGGNAWQGQTPTGLQPSPAWTPQVPGWPPQSQAWPPQSQAWPPASAWPPGPGWAPPSSWPAADGRVAWAINPAPPGPTPGVAWAGIGSRFGALVIDAVFMGALFFLAALLAAALGMRDNYYGETEYSTASAIVLWIWALFFLVYHPVCWWRFQCTLGQRALGIRVVREADGRPLGLGSVILRYVVWFVLMLTVILAIIAAIVADGDPARRAWHDEASGSVVIKPLH